ncbi:MAG: diguanylate cyclase [Kiritimatiellia bacterium]
MKLENGEVEQVVENLHDGLYLVDRNRIITYWNKAAEAISGFSAEEVVGKACAHNVLTHVDAEGRSLCARGCPLAGAMSDGNPRRVDMYMHHKAGHRIPVSVRVTALAGKNGGPAGAIELFSDISHQAANELRVKELEKLALLDRLTQLANRAYVEQEIHSRFEDKKRFGLTFGMLFIDIDHFKKFNDTHGHDVGDLVLKFVANTFVANARPSDLYGRWGGEEFIGILRNVDAVELEAVSARLRSMIENSYLMHGDQRLQVTVSMGATIGRADDTLETLVKRADRLLYQSKADGRNRVTLG